MCQAWVPHTHTASCLAIKNSLTQRAGENLCPTLHITYPTFRLSRTEHLAGLLVSVPDRLPPQAHTLTHTHTHIHTHTANHRTRSTDSGTGTTSMTKKYDSSTLSTLLRHEAFYRHTLGQLFLAAHTPERALRLLGQSLAKVRGASATSGEGAGSGGGWKGRGCPEGGSKAAGTDLSNAVEFKGAAGEAGIAAASGEAATGAVGGVAASEVGGGEEEDAVTSRAAGRPHCTIGAEDAASTPAAMPSSPAFAAVSGAACQLACCMLEKLTKRGYAGLVADVLLGQARSAVQVSVSLRFFARALLCVFDR